MNRKQKTQVIEAIGAGLAQLGLDHMEDADLAAAIAAGLDGPKGTTKGAGAVTVKMRAALKIMMGLT